ncbi:hypothetical protein L484_014357 [Morus notabilis]|uniref:Uncharacterized protein n=1 Tax=Morus notabilis TaxID=981085 RepID=W9RKW2_9ROSA|nr:hypothetical protein L484_014357 [Morus notabilis]
MMQIMFEKEREMISSERSPKLKSEASLTSNKWMMSSNLGKNVSVRIQEFITGSWQWGHQLTERVYFV